jgi:FkbM family methyltransferase
VTLADWVAEAKASAAVVEHPWDVQALDWPLTAESVVVEVGGYKGRWALQIAERYAPRLYVFEPQPWAAEVCRAALGKRANVWECALGTINAPVYMGKWETDGCSLIQQGDAIVQMFEARAIFAEAGITHIDLMLVNIEGYEYTLIPHMLDHDILPDRLMVQLHGADDANANAALFDRLAASGYRVAWTFGTVLTAWEHNQ